MSKHAVDCATVLWLSDISVPMPVCDCVGRFMSSYAEPTTDRGEIRADIAGEAAMCAGAIGVSERRVVEAILVGMRPERAEIRRLHAERDKLLEALTALVERAEREMIDPIDVGEIQYAKEVIGAVRL